MSSPDRAHVSVVVPTHARPQSLAACIAALGRLDYPAERLEIVVVDDGSPVPVTRGALDRGRHPLRVVRQDRAGPAAARNVGAGLADGELVAFVDDDCAPEPAWLSLLEPHLVDERPAIAGGRTVNALPGNRYSDASQALVAYFYDYYATRRPEHRYFTSNNLAVPRARFLSAGGFDTRFPRAAGEDREFCLRCVHRGFELVYEPRAVVGHAHALTLGSFWRQHLAYGEAARMCHAAMAARDESPFEALGFYARLVTYPQRIALRQPFAASALLCVAQAATAMGYALEAGRARRR